MNENIDVRSFFTQGEKVWVSDNFRHLILETYAGGGEEVTVASMGSADLQDITSDTRPESFIFTDVDAFLQQLAQLIQGQIDGESGKLLNDSSANYFFLQAKDGKLYSILVRWEPAQKLWRCGAYLQEDLKFPNIRIFRPM